MGHLLIFDISGGELMLILVVVLMFFGSKGLPGIARTLGRTMRQIRDASAEVQREIQRGAQDVRQEGPSSRPAVPKSTPPGEPARGEEEEDAGGGRAEGSS